MLRMTEFPTEGRLLKSNCLKRVICALHFLAFLTISGIAKVLVSGFTNDNLLNIKLSFEVGLQTEVLEWNLQMVMMSMCFHSKFW